MSIQSNFDFFSRTIADSFQDVKEIEREIKNALDEMYAGTTGIEDDLIEPISLLELSPEEEQELVDSYLLELSPNSVDSYFASF